MDFLCSMQLYNKYAVLELQCTVVRQSLSFAGVCKWTGFYAFSQTWLKVMHAVCVGVVQMHERLKNGDLN